MSVSSVKLDLARTKRYSGVLHFRYCAFFYVGHGYETPWRGYGDL
jgi:hypothetical protein